MQAHAFAVACLYPGLNLLRIVKPPGKIGIRRRCGCCVAGGGGSLFKLGVPGISGSLRTTCGDARQHQECGSNLQHSCTSQNFRAPIVRPEESVRTEMLCFRPDRNGTRALRLPLHALRIVSSLQHHWYANDRLVQSHRTKLLRLFFRRHFPHARQDCYCRTELLVIGKFVFLLRDLIL
jgi:hypothetical protein